MAVGAAAETAEAEEVGVKLGLKTTPDGKVPDIQTYPHLEPAGNIGTGVNRHTGVASQTPVHGKTLLLQDHPRVETVTSLTNMKH